MLSSVLEHKDYVAYLREAFPPSGPERGKRSRLAGYLKCQVSFISQVLTGRAQLSLEQALRVTEFLNLGDEERDSFLLTLQRDRAGTPALKAHFESKLLKKKRKRRNIHTNLQVEDLPSAQHQFVYYSSWAYVACHILCALPQFSTRESLRKQIDLDDAAFENCLAFLKSAGFIEEKNGKLKIKRTRVHLDLNSPMLARHHANWRVKAIQRVEHRRPDDLHYSGFIGISRDDGERIREKLLAMLRDTEKTISASPEEAAYVLLMDFWQF